MNEPLSDLELEQIFDAAVAEVARRQFASGHFGQREDGRDWPVFASQEWAISVLAHALFRVKLKTDELRATVPANSVFDPDKYVHVVLPGRHRFLRTALRKLDAKVGYVTSLNPADEREADILVTELRRIGIPAHYIVRYRDLGEERVSVGTDLDVL